MLLLLNSAAAAQLGQNVTTKFVRSKLDNKFFSFTTRLSIERYMIATVSTGYESSKNFSAKIENSFF